MTILTVLIIWLLLGYLSYQLSLWWVDDHQPADYWEGFYFSLIGPLIWLVCLSVWYDKRNDAKEKRLKIDLYQGLVTKGVISANEYRQIVSEIG